MYWRDTSALTSGSGMTSGSGWTGHLRGAQRIGERVRSGRKRPKRNLVVPYRHRHLSPRHIRAHLTTLEAKPPPVPVQGHQRRSAVLLPQALPATRLRDDLGLTGAPDAELSQYLGGQSRAIAVTAMFPRGTDDAELDEQVSSVLRKDVRPRRIVDRHHPGCGDVDDAQLTQPPVRPIPVECREHLHYASGRAPGPRRGSHR